jgi:hypothetical protein
VKLHMADNTTEASPVTYAGLPPRTAPPDPIDCDLGITQSGAVAFIIIALMLVLLLWGSRPCMR